jgi:hypothetical protein
MEKILGEHEVGGYALATGGIVQTVSFPTAPIMKSSAALNPAQLKATIGASTVMCCW